MSTSGTTIPSRRRRFSLFRRGPWEVVATVIIAAGVVMLMQPVSLTVYGWSFAVTLAGTVMFIVVSKFPE